MSHLEHADLAAPAFGHALRGYERGAVDAYVAATDRRIAELTAEIGRLHAAVAAAESSVVHLDEPAADIVRTATERVAQVVAAARGDLDPQLILDRARDECEVLLIAAQSEADKMVEDARRQAATINERARQEHAWRRRQVRREQDLVDLRKQQIVREIKALSVLATQTAAGPAGVEPVEAAVS